MATPTPATATSARTKGADVDSLLVSAPPSTSRIGLTSPAMAAAAMNAVGQARVVAKVADQGVAMNARATPASPRPHTTARYTAMPEGGAGVFLLAPPSSCGELRPT